MDSPRVLYLAYGSNLHPQRLTARVGEPLAARTVRLTGWALRFHKRSRDGSAKCDIVPSHRGHIYGVVYTMTVAAKRSLDRIEGLGFGYALKELHAPGLGNVTTYRATAAVIDSNLRPYSWYHQLVVAGARHHGFPPNYLSELTAVATMRDPDATRHRRELRLLLTA